MVFVWARKRSSDRSSGFVPRRLAVLCCAAALWGCSETTEEAQAPAPPPAPPPAAVETWELATAPQPAVSRSTQEPSGATARRSLGNNVLFNERAARPAQVLDIGSSDGESFSVDLVDVPIQQAADAVLRLTLGLEYAVSPGVEGNISFQTTRPLPRDAIFETFANILAANGLTISDVDGIFTIRPSASETQRIRLPSGPIAPAGGIYIMPLQFISAIEMQRILEPIAANTLRIWPDTTRNILFTSGPRRDIEAVLEAVNIFDVNIMRGKSVSRVQLMISRPSIVAQELDSIFDSGPGGALEGVLRFVPNDALGSILIISARRQYIREAELWISDYERATGQESRVAVVYRLENRDALTLAPVLQELLAASGGTLRVAEEGLEGEAVDEGAVAPIEAGLSPFSIVADPEANAIIVNATPGQHQEVSQLISNLDNVDDQVLIEATIAEVSLNDQLDFGVRYFFESGNFAVNFTGLATTGVGPVIPGFNALFDDGNAAVALNALASVTDVTIVSSPSLMVLDNREAVLNVGDQVPIATQTSTQTSSGDAPIINSIEQRDTGVILRLRPRVASTGRVILEVSQEVSNVVETDTSGIDSPTVQQRIISTTVAIDDGESLVLGGLIRETTDRAQAKVPLLGDIPVLGALFRDTNDKDIRTELIVIITPRVVRNSEEARRVTDEYRGRLSKPGELLDPAPSDSRHQLRRIFL